MEDFLTNFIKNISNTFNLNNVIDKNYNTKHLISNETMNVIKEVSPIINEEENKQQMNKKAMSETTIYNENYNLYNKQQNKQQFYGGIISNNNQQIFNNFNQLKNQNIQINKDEDEYSADSVIIVDNNENKIFKEKLNEENENFNINNVVNDEKTDNIKGYKTTVEKKETNSNQQMQNNKPDLDTEDLLNIVLTKQETNNNDKIIEPMINSSEFEINGEIYKDTNNNSSTFDNMLFGSGLGDQNQTFEIEDISNIQTNTNIDNIEDYLKPIDVDKSTLSPEDLSFLKDLDYDSEKKEFVQSLSLF